MDPAVLAAQQWVNATYTGVSGFQPVAEDGITGWQSMYALTRALQHELGITTLSNNFGPTTISTLAARPGGGISVDDNNQNLIKILQCAGCCKGYYGFSIDGVFGGSTLAAVGALMEESGLGYDQYLTVVPPKVMKAMLNMDAYVRLSGGLDAVRDVQRWMNQRYINRANFFIIPCDGVFSRSVQQALYLAIQFELGMTDAQATGVFGPGTQAGLQAHQLTEESGGIFVNLFSAAMIFNNAYSTFTENFTSELASKVRDFQRFSELAETGTGNFDTWCQLLISTGNPERPGTALDCIDTITSARAQTLVAAGYTTVGRYLDERPSNDPLNKRIQPGELATIFAHGLRVFPISQYDGDSLSYFTAGQGFTDGVDAHNAANGYGFSAGTVIYFAVDFDATQPDIDGNGTVGVTPYFRGVVNGLASMGKKYVHGVYGSRNVCQQMYLKTYALRSFVSGMSTGFSGNMGFPLPANWSFNQIKTLTIGSGAGQIEIDKNIANGTDPGVNAVNTPPTSLSAFLDYVHAIYLMAIQYVVSHPSEDANDLTLQYIRASNEKYTGISWRVLVSSLNADWLDFVESWGVPRTEVKFADPFYGIELESGHLGASTHAHYRITSGGTSTNRADFAGWGGDWITAYGEWRDRSDSYASGSAYCAARLAKPINAEDNAFDLLDMIADADAFLIAQDIAQGANASDAIRDHYTTGYLSRFTRFYAGRFGGTVAGTKALADDMLTSNDDDIITDARLLLWTKESGVVAFPNTLPGGVLDDFCQGFANTLTDLVAQEHP